MDDPPRSFPHEVRLVPHGSKDGDREVELLAEAPLAAIEIASDATAIQDRRTGRISVARTPIDIAPEEPLPQPHRR